MIWGAMNNASTAMMATSWDMGSISQNISNVNTTGYKRKETLFKTVMSESKAGPSTNSGKLNIFGVKTADRYHIEQQGTITGSNWNTDLAINGRGFLLVAPPSTTTSGTTVSSNAPTSSSVDDPASVLYTRDGSFHFVSGPNQEKYFTTAGGNYVLGWMADDTGTIDQTGALTPVYTLPETIMEGRETTEASIFANIPRDATLSASNFNSTSTFTDPLGASQTLTLNWSRVDATTWTVTPSVDAAVGAVSSAAMTVTMDSNGNITAPATFAAEPVSINWDDGAYGAATADSATTINLSSSKPSIPMQKIYLEVFDSNFNSHTVTLGFERSGVNTWYMHVLPGSNATTGANPTPIDVTFNEDGKMVTGSPASLALSWTSGTEVGTATVALDMDGMTQYDGDLHLDNIATDGYGSGTLISSGFNEKGEMHGQFTNGKTRALFKLPIAQFVAENNLEPISGNLFRRSRQAGDITVSSVEDAVGAPRFSPSSLEASNVDIGQEFTKMIVTQKAYTTNATVFKTADEMTTVARDLKA